jgi:hypothetical protein
MAGFADDRFGPRLAQLTRCAELDAESRDVCKHHSFQVVSKNAICLAQRKQTFQFRAAVADSHIE